MFFCLIYLHWPNVPSREAEILQCVGSFTGSRRTFRESWANVTSNVRVPATVYYIEAPEEAATLLKLKGFIVTILEDEPLELRNTSELFEPDFKL